MSVLLIIIHVIIHIIVVHVIPLALLYVVKHVIVQRFWRVVDGLSVGVGGVA